MGIHIEILPERTMCLLSIIFKDHMNMNGLNYCFATTEEYMHTSKMMLMGGMLQLRMFRRSRSYGAFVFHFRFQAVQLSYELQVHYDSPKHCK